MLSGHRVIRSLRVQDQVIITQIKSNLGAAYIYDYTATSTERNTSLATSPSFIH